MLGLRGAQQPPQVQPASAGFNKHQQHLTGPARYTLCSSSAYPAEHSLARANSGNNSSSSNNNNFARQQRDNRNSGRATKEQEEGQPGWNLPDLADDEKLLNADRSWPILQREDCLLHGIGCFGASTLGVGSCLLPESKATTKTSKSATTTATTMTTTEPDTMNDQATAFENPVSQHERNRKEHTSSSSSHLLDTRAARLLPIARVYPIQPANCLLSSTQASTNGCRELRSILDGAQLQNDLLFSSSSSGHPVAAVETDSIASGKIAATYLAEDSMPEQRHQRLKWWQHNTTTRLEAEELEGQLEYLANEYLNKEDKLNLFYYLNQYQTNACDLSELLTNLIQNSLIKLPDSLIKYKLLTYIKQLYIDNDEATLSGSEGEPEEVLHCSQKSIDEKKNGNDDKSVSKLSWAGGVLQQAATSRRNPQLDLLLFDTMIHQYLIASNALMSSSGLLGEALASDSWQPEQPEAAGRLKHLAERKRKRRQRRAIELATQRQQQQEQSQTRPKQQQQQLTTTSGYLGGRPLPGRRPLVLSSRRETSPFIRQRQQLSSRQRQLRNLGRPQTGTGVQTNGTQWPAAAAAANNFSAPLDYSRERGFDQVGGCHENGSSHQVVKSSWPRNLVSSPPSPSLSSSPFISSSSPELGPSLLQRQQQQRKLTSTSAATYDQASGHCENTHQALPNSSDAVNASCVVGLPPLASSAMESSSPGIVGRQAGWRERNLLSSSMASLAIGSGGSGDGPMAMQRPSSYSANQNIYLPPKPLFAKQQQQQQSNYYNRQEQPSILFQEASSSASNRNRRRLNDMRPRSVDYSPPPPPEKYPQHNLANQYRDPYSTSSPPPPPPFFNRNSLEANYSMGLSRGDASNLPATNWQQTRASLEFPSGRPSGWPHFDTTNTNHFAAEEEASEEEEAEDPVSGGSFPFDYELLVNERRPPPPPPHSAVTASASEESYYWRAAISKAASAANQRHLVGAGSSAGSTTSAGTTAGELLLPPVVSSSGGGGQQQICQCDQCSTGSSIELEPFPWQQSSRQLPPTSSHHQSDWQPDQQPSVYSQQQQHPSKLDQSNMAGHNLRPSPFAHPPLFEQRSASVQSRKPGGGPLTTAADVCSPLLQEQRCFSSMSVPYEGQQLSSFQQPVATTMMMTPFAASPQQHQQQQQQQHRLQFVNTSPADCCDGRPLFSRPRALGLAGPLNRRIAIATHSSLPSSPVGHRYNPPMQGAAPVAAQARVPSPGCTDGLWPCGGQDFSSQQQQQQQHRNRQHHQSIQLKDWPGGDPQAGQLKLSAVDLRRQPAAAARSATINDSFHSGGGRRAQASFHRASQLGGGGGQEEPWEEEGVDQEEEEEEEEEDEFSGDECALVPLQAKGKLPLSVAEQMERQASNFVHQYGSANSRRSRKSRATSGPNGPASSSQMTKARGSSSSRKRRKPNLFVRRTLRVKIQKSKPILGIAIEGGFNVSGQLLPRVVCVHEDGAAYQCGKLRASDLILEVNGNSTVNMTHDQIAKTIATAYYQDPRPYIEFLIGESMPA